MSLPDITKYPIAGSPWPYATAAAQLSVWGYKPVGDHSQEALFDPDGLLAWEKIDPDTGHKKAFVLSTPRWQAKGMSEPVWPSQTILGAMEAQEVFQRAGSSDQEHLSFQALTLARLYGGRSGL